jgi:hypothetical protein
MTPAATCFLQTQRLMLTALSSSFRPLVSCARKPSILVLAILGLSVAIPLYFTFSTHLVWEDFLITYRFSENLAHGQGLVYTPGERVCGFTSPLNTLLPALFSWVTGAKEFWLPLWLFRCVSLAGLVFACIAITSLLTREPEAATSRVAWFLCLLFPLVAVLEIKTTAFTMSGQEAGLVLGFLAPAFALACLGWSAHWVLGGFLWAGLMYSRPDAFVYIGALTAAAFAYSPDPARTLARTFLKSAAICALLYLPWLLFTWIYYGSPIPHTVVAKFGINAYDTTVFGLLAPVAAGMRKAPEVLCWTFAPIYDWLDVVGPGTWPRWIHDGAAACELFAILYWLIPSADRIGRMASLFSFLLFGYLVYENIIGQYAPWYFPPLAFMSLLAIVCAIANLSRGIGHRASGAAVGVLLMSGLLAFLVFIFSTSLRPLRFKQEVIEWNHRRLIGLWLKEQVAPGEAVFLEPLGYIGYFSRCKMLDWPGLVSPEVVRARRTITRKSGYTWIEVAESLKPAWIVARVAEGEAMKNREFFVKNYELMKIFDVSDKITATGLVTGMSMVYAENAFAVYHLRQGR